MKQFIVLAAILPILMVFTMQFMLSQTQFDRATEAANAVTGFREKTARSVTHAGDYAVELQARLAKIYQVETADVLVEWAESGGSAVDAEAFRVLQYRISVPTGEIMAAGAFMGLSAGENEGRLSLSGEIVVGL